MPLLLTPREGMTADDDIGRVPFDDGLQSLGALLVDDVDRVRQGRFLVGAFVHRAEEGGGEGHQRLVAFHDREIQQRGTFLDRVDDIDPRGGVGVVDILL